MKRTLQFFVALMLLTYSTDLLAEKGEDGDIEISPYAGYGFFDKYAGIEPKNALLYGARLGYFVTPTVSFEPSFQLLTTEPDATGGDLTFYSTRFNLLYNFLPGSSVRPFITGGVGWEKLKVDGGQSSNDLGVNAGLGLRWFFNEWLAARLDGRFNYVEVGDSTSSARQYNYEGALGVSFLFGVTGPKDADGDGVKDKDDQCAATPTGATVDAKGCPADEDGDKVFDGLDKCPATPVGATVAADGCPKDSDTDAVFDGIDACADTPKDTPVDEKGCTKILDKDGDGVLDDKDQCPETPAEIKVDEKGCSLDSDGDSILDGQDKCPGTEKGVAIDEAGCPKVTKARGVLKGVNFKFNSADLLPESFATLDAVATELQEFPEVRVEVQGHTDNVGPTEVNERMSHVRSETVKNYLVSKGVAVERLDAKGFGGSKPLVPNKNPANRRKNRRVELNWLN